MNFKNANAAISAILVCCRVVWVVPSPRCACIIQPTACVCTALTYQAFSSSLLRFYFNTQIPILKNIYMLKTEAKTVPKLIFTLSLASAWDPSHVYCQVSRFGRESHGYLPLLTVSRRELLFSRISSWVSLFFQIKRFSDSKVVLVIMFHALFFEIRFNRARANQ